MLRHSPIRQRQRKRRAESSDRGNGSDHEQPVDSRYIYLPGGDTRGMTDPDSGETLHADELVDEGVGGRDHG